MKVQLTETQYNLVRLIKENTDFAEKIKNRIKDIKGNLDKLYTIITFTTIAELRDGETDILIIESKLEVLDDRITTINQKINDYFDRYDEETFYAKKLDDVMGDLENRIITVRKKLRALTDIINQLKPFSKVDEFGRGREKDWDEPFENIKPLNIS